MSEREEQLGAEAIETAETQVAPKGASARAGGGSSTLARGAKFGRYMIVDQLGVGGMGVVYTAYDAELDRKIALKLLRPATGKPVATGDSDNTDERRSRLQREAQAMAKVAHPNVIHVYDVGTVEDQLFIAMELVDGQSLKTWNKKRRSWRDTLSVYRGAGKGLAAAHSAGLVHRDFKPDNVLVGNDDRVRVLDFGLARAAAGALDAAALAAPELAASRQHELESHLTETGFVVGTPAYMAPEQHRGDATDARSDQFAFCVALWEALFGERPFAGKTPDELAQNASAGAIRTPSRSGVPTAVRRALEKGLSAAPGDRYQSMSPLLQALTVAPSRARRNLAIGAAVLAVLGAGTAYGVHRYQNRLITEHYANFTEVYGKPQGLSPLDSEARSHRQVYWRMTHRKGRVLSMQRLAGSGRPAPDDTGAWTWSYEYTNGSLREVVSRDKRARVVLRLLVSEKQTRLERRDTGDNPLPFPSTDAAVIHREFDADGHTVRQRFTNVYGAPRPDHRRAFGYQATIGELGLPVEWYALGADGSPTPTADGIARVTRAYDAGANLIEQRFYGTQDQPTLNQDAIAGSRYVYDEWGNRTETSHLNTNGEVDFSRFGYAITTTTYDQRGQATAVDYLDAKHKPVQPNNGMSARMAYDQRGNLIELSFVGPDGKMASNRDGVAVVHHQYDDQDNRTVSSWFDAERKATRNSKGAATERSAYDENGNRIEAHYFDAQALPTYVEDGYARIRASYDNNNRLVRETYLGPKGKPVRLPAGYASIGYRYDSRGRRTSQAFLNPDGTPAMSTSGYASVHTEYDEQSNATAVRYLDRKGNAAVSTSGVATVRYQYDSRGNRIAERYFDAKDAATPHKTGYAALQREFDGRGHPLKLSYLGTDGAPLRNANGIAIELLEYDERGRLVRSWYRDPKGEPTLHKQGYAEARYQLDERSNRVDTQYFDTKGKPTIRDHGYARMLRRYDDDDNVVYEAFFSVTGKPSLNQIGAAELHYGYDDRGNRTEIRALGKNGKPTVSNDWYARLAMQYDQRNKLIRRSRYGPDGELMHNAEGFAIEQWTYNGRGRLTMVGYLGTHEKPINTARGYASVRRFYDTRGREIRRTFLDEQTKIVAGEHGVASIETKYGYYGRPVQTTYFDTKGRATLDANGIAATVIRYSVDGLQIGTRFLDLEGKLKARSDGVASIQIEPDPLGRPASILTNGIDGQLVVNSQGVAVTQRSYDDRGLLVRESYLGTDRKPVNNNDGYASISLEYDGRGRESARSFKDATSAAGETVQGVHRLIKRYDQRGNQIRLDAFDRAGKPVRIGTGPAGFVYTYAAPDRLVRIVGYDQQGAPIEGTMYLDQLYVWRYRGGNLYFFDASRQPVRAPALLGRLGQRAWAMMRSYEMEKLRATQPELFAGARGLAIMEVPPQSEAQHAGLAVGDIILSYNGQNLDSEDDLETAAGAAVAKQLVQLGILRAGEKLTLDARPRILGAVLEPQ